MDESGGVVTARPRDGAEDVLELRAEFDGTADALDRDLRDVRERLCLLALRGEERALARLEEARGDTIVACADGGLSGILDEVARSGIVAQA
ncbi:MAG: hypothetical protein AB7L94_13955 [Kofleriaceae bacterium]